MITKIKNIKNLAVFKDFNWDASVRDKGNNIINFKKINILYGRNYSGKTTLSRIIRALETGEISDKYENPECAVCITDNTDVTQSNFSNHSKVIRVFNEDFIEDNLKFIVNSNESVESFAILGEGNNEIEEEIEALKTTLGSNENDNESGLYLQLKSLKGVSNTSKTAHSTAKSSLNAKLAKKATGNPTGIKYQSKYGEVNYDIRKLKADILTVKASGYVPLSEEEKLASENILVEQTKNEIPSLSDLTLNFTDFYTRTKEIVGREIGQSNKIDLLLKDAILNKWVKEGRKLHEDKKDTCSFCNNQISENRWSELEKHFDEESDQLEKDLNTLLVEIENEKKTISQYKIFQKELIYSKFNSEYDKEKNSLDTEIKNYQNAIASLKKQLETRKKDVLNKKEFLETEDFSDKISDAKNRIDTLRVKSNEYSEKLSSDQTKARKNLRLKDVSDFIIDINYDVTLSAIASLKATEEADALTKKNKQDEIDTILSQISEKQKQLKDESKGAEKVNEYLNNHFGHDFLKLVAVEFEDEQTGNKFYRFEIHREGRKAYHLSEGEKSLIAFCYFVAKLSDVDTKTKEPIIWIDDPISSLDSNHIFFIYSLIKTKIYNNRDFEQIFISTHNLNFLKYLQRLPSHNDKKNDRVRHFMIERIDQDSTISEMPNYIKKNISEFNHLFKHIFECSTIENITDENYTVFYNFGNNARKFLEIYLFYRYPDATGDLDKMKKFFGDEDIPAVLTERINNEYSHLAGVFERGQLPVEVPEMKKAATLIIDKIKEHDENQFNSFVSSTGIQNQ
ncbi:AAA family ATPase [Polaribacter sp. Z022]|uniref:AAA family ATPase n=1 Tax=Polaribacter sp. Z022 TaxID=2927125 RepID=UPI002021336C|nr:AAA family ATPase [Polaribacter sp. Z022]MCL7752447.1 AAA family ATPase [Polaribacter sp. Z022]